MFENNKKLICDYGESKNIMNKEHKQLLLQDLCARVIYGVKVTTTNRAVELGIVSGTSIEGKISVETKDADIVFECTEVKPYLRSMSSMTEEEKREYASFIGGQKPFDSDYSAYPKEHKYVYEWDVANYVNWLNSHHFDYRGLIEKNLAIEVTEKNNPYES